MNNTGKFIAIAQVSGRAMDSAGNIIERDTHGLPTMWFTVIAGTIPNRQTVTGSVAMRAGVRMDANGVIPPGETTGHPFGKRLVYGSWLHQSDHELYGPQFSWSIIKDMSNASVEEIDNACDKLGQPVVFTVDRPPLPEDYQRKTTQHIGRSKLDPMVHGTANQVESVPAELAKAQVGARRSDTDFNPEVTISRTPENPTGGARVNNPQAGQANPDNEDEIIS
jgi:hypothetical protein